MKQSFVFRTVLAGFAVTAMTSACSLNQDPYADKSEAIKQGVPPEVDRPPVAPKPLASDAVRIDTNDFYSFKEQTAGEISVRGRVLDSSGATFDLSIDNLRDFPGAVFDPTSGAFKWTPPRDTTGGEYGVPKRLVVRLTAISPTGGTSIGTIKEILVYVTRAELDPQIVSVEDLVKPSPTREGQARKFLVTVKDPDAIDADGLRPRLVAVPSKRGTFDISGLVYMQDPTSSEPNPSQDPNDKTKWIFKMVLDLRAQPDQRGRDFTRSQETFKFGLQTVSRFGRIGMKDVDASILTDVMKPEVSWGIEPIEAVVGQENVLQFTVYDPYAEGRISVNFKTRIDQLPGAGVAFCNLAPSRDGAMICRISYKPSAAALSAPKGEYPVEFVVRNESKVQGDTKVVEETFRRVIKVVPGAGSAAPVANAVPTNVTQPVVNPVNAPVAPPATP